MINEKSNISLMREKMMDKRNKYFTPENCDIPTPFDDLCGEKVLVMSFLPGPKLEDGLFPDEKDRMSRGVFDVFSVNKRVQDTTSDKSNKDTTSDKSLDKSSSSWVS